MTAANEPKTTIHARQAIAGDAASLEWLVARFAPVLVSHAAYRLGPDLRRHYEPDDLVNDAWLVALPRLATLGADDTRATPVLLKFLSTTITLRTRNLLRQHVRDGAPRVGDAGGDELAATPADVSGAITRAIRREHASALRDRIDALPDADREILMLRGLEQLPFATIAMLLERTEAAVAKRYERALTRLREAFPGSVLDELE